MINLEIIGSKAKKASRILAIERAKKDKALERIATDILAKSSEIIEANQLDLAEGKAKNLSQSLLDRLELNQSRVEDIAQSIREVIALEDPVGRVLSGKTNANGLQIKKITVPLGVICMIYEARPNVTVDAAVLCLKSSNAVILRGGKEAIHSNICLANIMREAIKKEGLPEDCIQLIEDTSREVAAKLMKLNRYVDVLIPRGGAGLIKTVVENSTIPVIETGTGNCHIYVDASADFEMASNIIYNAKTSRPSVCNAVETVLVHKDVAQDFLPQLKIKLDDKHVELRACKKSLEILDGVQDNIKQADEADWEKEYGDYILAIKVVDNINEAIEHIAKYSTGHSEAIVTSNYENSKLFTENIDSAAVYVNASTRFTDGGMFGLGAEIGISTQKLHARGPMGLNELTSIKFIVEGSGQVR